jgi:hypothetical protein
MKTKLMQMHNATELTGVTALPLHAMPQALGY